MDFTNTIDMPYPTMQAILRRGLDNSSIGNIFKICKGLDISVDELAKGNIVPNKTSQKEKAIEILVANLKAELLNDYITLDGQAIRFEETITLHYAFDLCLDLIRKEREGFPVGSYNQNLTPNEKEDKDVYSNNKHA